MKYISLPQNDLYSIFDEETEITRGGPRFICLLPWILESMKKQFETDPNTNFYDYIMEAAA